ESLALEVADIVDAVGVLAVELFLVDGRLLVNEVAPRPHNSGHITMEASATSQFENHLRAVLGWPLGSPALRAPAATMVNVFGPADGSDPRSRASEALRNDVHLHLYGKTPRPGRKLGHVNAVADSVDDARARAWAAAGALGTEPPRSELPESA
ncbi:MAG: ATP-grasp domain-containing protein, partial [Acidimicrobiia bacterium]